MRIIVILSLLVHLLVTSAKGQISKDTVYVNSKQNCYLAFPKDVELMDIPLGDDYFYKIEGKTIFLRAKSTDSRNTGYLVKCGDDFYEGQIIIRSQLQKTFYDFRNVTHEVTTTTTVKTIVHSDNDIEPFDTVGIRLKERFNNFKNESIKRYKTEGIVKHNIYFGLCNLKHDKENTYIKLNIINRSSLTYNIDFVQFEIVEGNTIRNEVKIVLEAMGKEVSSNKKEAPLYFVLPLLSIPESCSLRITLRELNGLRTIILDIPSKIILTADSYNFSQN